MRQQHHCRPHIMFVSDVPAPSRSNLSVLSCSSIPFLVRSVSIENHFPIWFCVCKSPESGITLPYDSSNVIWLCCSWITHSKSTAFNEERHTLFDGWVSSPVIILDPPLSYSKIWFSCIDDCKSQLC